MFKEHSTVTFESPPRPPLAIRVGVTGHRISPTRTPPNLGDLRATLQTIFSSIASECQAVHQRHRSLYCSNGRSAFGDQPILRVVSGLAEGADQWLAEAAIDNQFELQALLAFPRDEFRRDFDNEESLLTLDKLLGKATAAFELDGRCDYAGGMRSVDPKSYRAVRDILIDQSDLLVALWDGSPDVVIGGTTDVVNEARRRGTPVIWIRWNEPQKWCLLNVADESDETRCEESGPLKELETVVRRILPPPQVNEQLQSDLHNAYLDEQVKTGNVLLGWWALFRNLMSGEPVLNGNLFRADALDVERERQSLVFSQMPPVPPKEADDENHKALKKTTEPDSSLAEHYAWANHLALYYSYLYRSSFVLIFLLSAVAVFCAVMSLMFPIAALCELVFIGVIIGLTAIGRRQRWHERWIDYRTLAERLRLGRFLRLLGGGDQGAAIPAHLANYGDPKATWMYWHFRAVERAAGLPNVRIDEGYLKACVDAWQTHLLKEQVEYHKQTSDRYKHLDHRLHLAGTVLFTCTLLVCIIHVGLDVSGRGEHYGVSSWLVLFAAGLPALGAALAGIRTQGEFHRAAERSAAMHVRLAALNDDIERVSTASGQLHSAELRRCVSRIAHLMINEMLDWRVVFQDRPLVLPA